MDPETRASRANAGSSKRRLDLRWPTLRRQFAECVLLPAIGVTLPWPLAWQTMRALAALGRVFGRETSEAQAMCAAQDLPHDPRSWARRYRLVRMVDHVDPAISATRSDRWMDRNLTVEGDAVPPGPCIFIGFHYGTGFWSLRHLRRLGHRVAVVFAPPDPNQRHAEPLRVRYTNWRLRQVVSAGGAPVIYTGSSGNRIRAALRDGTSILALIDVPEPTTATTKVSVLDHEMRLPDGIVRIGASAKVPLVGYVAALDVATGMRRLRFTRLPSQPADALRAAARLLDAAIRSDSAGWHFWGQWPRFIAGAAPPAANEREAAARVR